MSNNDKKAEFRELKTPKERRKWIEALHEENHGKNDFAEQARSIYEALGGRFEKKSVLEVMAETLGSEPIESKGVYRIGIWELRFDSEDRLHSMSASSGIPGMIQTDDEA